MIISANGCITETMVMLFSSNDAPLLEEREIESGGEINWIGGVRKWSG